MKFWVGLLSVLLFVCSNSAFANVLEMEPAIQRPAGSNLFLQVIDSANYKQNKSLISCCRVGFMYAFTSLRDENEMRSSFEQDIISLKEKGYQISCLQSCRKSGAAYVAHILHHQDPNHERIIIDHFGYCNDDIAFEAFAYILNTIQSKTQKELAYFMTRHESLSIKKSVKKLNFVADQESKNNEGMWYVLPYISNV